MPVEQALPRAWRRRAAAGAGTSSSVSMPMPHRDQSGRSAPTARAGSSCARSACARRDRAAPSWRRSAGFSALNTTRSSRRASNVELAVVDVGQHPAVEAAVDGVRPWTVNEMYDSSPRTPNTRYERSPRICGEVVDRVGVVALHLAGRAHDRRHARVVGVALDEELRHAREHLGHVAVALDHVEVLGEALLVEDVAVADLGEQRR